MDADVVAVVRTDAGFEDVQKLEVSTEVVPVVVTE